MNTQTTKQYLTFLYPVRNLLLAMAAVAVMSACSPSAEEDSAKHQAIAEQARKELLAEQAAEKARQDEIKAQQDAAVAQAIAAERRAATGRARNDPQQPARSSTTRSICSNCGVVLAVNETKTAGKGTPLGVIAGGVVGGLLGNQVGKGTGRDIATVAGAVGGAYAGNQIEKNVRKTTTYEVVVKMENGEELTVRQTTNPNVVKGDSIRIENEAVVKR